MKERVSTIVRKGTAPALLAAFLLLALPWTSPALRATRAGDRQDGGRPRGRVLSPPQRPPERPAPAAAVEWQGGGVNPAGAKVIRFDVAENGTRFALDETPVFGDGLPAYGNEFITEGYVYPYGTLAVGADGVVNGVNPDGTPEFPDKVIGRWTCRGWHVGEGAHTATGPWVVTQQLFDMDGEAGRQTLTTEGYELVDVNVPVRRAVTGGTGANASAGGEATQTFLGFNGSAGTASRHVFRLAKR
jgi:hypothetical protein